jgi:hypothetical protein
MSGCVALTLEVTDDREAQEDDREALRRASPVTETEAWFAWSPAPRPDLPRENRSPLHANRDWLRVLLPTPE